MKFLRDESGQIAVLRNPFSLRNKPATVEQHSAPPAQPPTAATSISNPRVTSHCCFICHWCGSPILLPHDQMGLPFAHPFLRKIEVRTIATACGSCRLIGSYSLFRGCPGFDTRYKLKPAPVSGATVLLEWLQCDTQGCPFPVPLFVNFENGLSTEDKVRLAAHWIWQDLRCMSGHRIHRAAQSHLPQASSSAV